MKKLGLLTIGQSPRDDLIPSLLEILGEEYEIIQAGALDDMTYEDVQKIPLREEDYILVSRMRDGREVKITKKSILPKLQEKIHEIENKGARVTVVMCTGKFPQFESNGLVVTPQEVLRGVIEGSLKAGKLGVVYPTEEQEFMAKKEFGREGVEVYADSVSPYEPEDIDGLIRRLRRENLDLIFLNCFGFPRELYTQVKKETGKPTILSNAVIARVLKELL
ncbi:AroM family protein [Candidatus Bathyarchaeota archaeon]|nr:AroM family protein [Candidatus Bathyarchaeota archaeon]